jgi:hypothetical protein
LPEISGSSSATCFMPQEFLALPDGKEILVTVLLENPVNN